LKEGFDMRARVARLGWSGWLGSAALLGAASAAGVGCDLVLGLDNPVPGAGGAGGTGGAVGGAGGSGGNGKICDPGSKQACKYTGDPATEDVGSCHAAEQTCDNDGTSWGACEGEVLPAIEVCHNQEDEDCDGAACAAPLWSEIWGDAGDQTVAGVWIDNEGNVALHGTFVGTLDLAEPPVTAPSLTPFFAKLDTDAAGLWNVTVEWSANAAFCNDSGKCVLCRDFSGIQFSALEADGSKGWQVAHGTGMGIFPHAAAANADSFVVIGDLTAATTFGGTVLSPNGGPDVFLVRVSLANGSLISADRFGTETAQAGRRVVMDAAGNTFVSGRYSGSLLLSNGEMANDDLFVFRVDPDGSAGWGAGFSGEWFGHDLALDTIGNTILAGRFTGMAQLQDKTIVGTGPADVFAAKLSAAGDIAWAKSFGGAAFQLVTDTATASASVATDSQGNIVVSTRATGTVDFGGGELGSVGTVSELLVKLDPDGNHLWSKAFGPVAEEGGCHVAVAPNDDVMLACSVDAPSINFGSSTLDGKGGLDVVVARFRP
jgi:hypothetical protein